VLYSAFIISFLAGLACDKVVKLRFNIAGNSEFHLDGCLGVPRGSAVAFLHLIHHSSFYIHHFSPTPKDAQFL
jgi:hypothetical protein